MNVKDGKSFSGYLTVYLAMILAIILSLYLALIEGVRSNAIRMEAEIVMDIGMNSIMAEYHRELYRQYNLFAVDTSYGTGWAGVSNTQAHLRDYLERNLKLEDVFLSGFFYKDFLSMSLDKAEITGVSNLADDMGTVFRRRAVEAIKDDVGITLLENLYQWLQTVKTHQLNERDIASWKKEIDAQILEYDGMEILISEEKWDTVTVQEADGQQTTRKVKISEAEYQTVEIENPTEKLEEIRAGGILRMVVDHPELLSGKRIHSDTLVAARMKEGNINKGNWEETETEADNSSFWNGDFVQRFLFQEYLLKYMSRYDSEEKNGALQYQVEYLLGGNDSDMGNLNHVVTVLSGIREVANAVYLFGNEEKCAVAELLATTIATLLMVPEIADLLQTTLLLGWAYAESLYDVETLLKGGRVPLMKDDSSWYYDLEAALNSEQITQISDKGLSYEDYLRILMSLTDIELLTQRAMNLVEADIRTTDGNGGFRLDACLDCVEAYGVFKSEFGYEYRVIRQKKY